MAYTQATRKPCPPPRCVRWVQPNCIPPVGGGPFVCPPPKCARWVIPDCTAPVRQPLSGLGCDCSGGCRCGDSSMSGLGKIAAAVARRRYLQGLGASAAGRARAVRAMRVRRGLRGLGDSVDIPTSGTYSSPIGPTQDGGNLYDPTLLPDSSIPDFQPSSLPNLSPTIIFAPAPTTPSAGGTSFAQVAKGLVAAAVPLVQAAGLNPAQLTPTQIAMYNARAQGQSWFSQQSIVGGIPNYAFAGVGGLLLLAMMMKRK